MKILDKLRLEDKKIRARIYKLEEEETERIQVPFLKSLVGKCFVYRNNSFGGDRTKWDVFRKVLEYVQVRKMSYLVFEEVQVDGNGKSSLSVEADMAYTNKEWFKAIPFSGFVECEDIEYLKARNEVLQEMLTRAALKKELNRKD